MISHEQHGFMAGRSCVTNLASFSQFLFETLDDSGQVDVIYTDFQKAFDKVDHQVLLTKLENRYGFCPQLICLLRSYLLHRRQYVLIEGFHSFQYPSISGVPQGSNLGPLLFLLFIDDLIAMFFTMRLLFADDFKFLLRVTCIQDCYTLQSALEVLLGWCESNGLRLNVSKCNVVSYTRRVEPLIFDYFIGDIKLIRSDIVRDLGVLFDSQLTFVPHINDLLNSVSRLYGFVVRNGRHFLNSDTLVLLFNTLVRTKLEYASFIWQPIYSRHKQRLESVQRRFYKFLSYREEGVYPPRGTDHAVLLNRFGAVSLADRRGLQAVSFLYNLVHGSIDCPYLLEKVNFYVPRPNMRTRPLFYLVPRRNNCMLRAPVQHMCYLFNNFCETCDIFHDTLRTIKQRYLNCTN